MKVVPVILAGGVGSRLWPQSTKEYPKQFLNFFSENSLLELTLSRLSGQNYESPVIICNAENRFIVADQCNKAGFPNSTIITEPLGCNTTLAIASVACYLRAQYDDCTMLILPSDHLIKDISAFRLNIEQAILESSKDKLITFSILPKSPHTGYGYIKLDKQNDSCIKVVAFHEKPSLENAKKYISSKKYFWNSGMFVFRLSTLVKEFIEYSKDLLLLAEFAYDNSIRDYDFIRLEKYKLKTDIDNSNLSIDKVLLEKSQKIFSIVLSSDWTDLGSWKAIYDAFHKDKNQNLISGNVYLNSTTNSYISSNGRIICTFGIDNLYVIDNPNITLISTKDRVSDLANLSKLLPKSILDSNQKGIEIYRPWGYYLIIEQGEKFQVKKLVVKPGAKLSLQSHQYRSEHWVVIKGVSIVHKDGEIYELNEGDSIFIDKNVKHSLENNSNETTEIIEVQSGTYLGEDDIIRYKDIYGRN